MYSGVITNTALLQERDTHLYETPASCCVCSVTRSDSHVNENKLMLAAGVRDMHVCSCVTLIWLHVVMFLFVLLLKTNLLAVCTVDSYECIVE